MYTVIIVLVASSVITTSLESCPEDFCPPTWKIIRVPEVEDTGSIALGVDKESGCMCREFPGKYSLCFGRANCRYFPKNVKITTNILIIRATQIFEIKPGDLFNMLHLETLKIEGNFNLSRILIGSFLHLDKLRNLSISSNPNLRILEEGSLDGLVNLKYLFLLKNGFVELTAVTPALIRLPNLIHLALSENRFVTVKQQNFEVLRNSSLKELNMILCQIENIEAGAFNPLTNLTALRLGENKFNADTITRVIEEVVAHVPLRLLNLYSIGLRRSTSRKLLSVIAKSNITSLCLARNQFEVIDSEMFPKMPNLKVLDLREVLALNITNDAFIGVPNLKSLLLSRNKLASIPEGALMEQLMYLDLQQNSGGSLSSSSYFSVYGQIFMNMKNLQQLNLSFNAIRALYQSSFLGLENLRVLGLKNSTIYNIANGTFVSLSKLLFLNLENNPFIQSHPMVLEGGIFKGLLNLRVLLLAGCGLRFISNKADPFNDLKNLEHLGLERNKLTVLSSFEIFVHLRTIDLSQNGLQPWHERVFNKNLYLTDVKVNDNKFLYLTPAMIKDFHNVTKLDLKNNPFTCDCSFAWNDHRIMELTKDQEIFCSYPDTTTSLTIHDFLQKHRNCYNWTLLILLTSVTIFLIIIIFSMYYFRWHLRYWFFLTRLHLSRNRKIRRNPQANSYTNYIYDAFVSYSSEDRNFVIRLVTMLENYPPYIKLCVYERDFEVGTIISENVLESVAKSRKTLLIISNSYAKSQWCRWESQIAEHHRLFFQNENGHYVDDSLILIKLGPVNEAHMTPTLRYLLKTRIYLPWDENEKKQKVFWDKLRAVLERPVEINENTYL